MLDHYRDEMTRFREALGREQFLHLSGQKDSLELRPIYERYADLMQPDTIEQLRKEYERTPEYFETQRRGITCLIAFAEEHYLESVGYDWTEQIATFEAEATLRVEDREVPFYRAANILATESNAEKRRQVNQRRLAIIAEKNEWRQERIRTLHQASQTLGHQNTWDMVTGWQGCNLSRYADLFADFLKQTADLYFRSLSEALPHTIGVSPDQADRADVDYFLQLAPYVDLFPPDGVIAAYQETMRCLGIDTQKQENVKIDSLQRPSKSPRSCCIPIRVPQDIRLSMCLRGGPFDYQTMLHEGGHAQHYAWTSPSLPAEFKLAGDPAVTEGYAFLFHYLTLDPLWLDELLHLPGAEDFVRLCWLHKLFDIRRYSAKLSYERLLHSTGDLPAASRQYADGLSQATGFRYQPEEYLYDLDDNVYAASYLRAWLLEVQLRDYLKTRFGKRWWTSAKAAEYLIDLWNTGGRYRAEELAGLADLGPLSLEALMNEFRQHLT